MQKSAFVGRRLIPYWLIFLLLCLSCGVLPFGVERDHERQSSADQVAAGTVVALQAENARPATAAAGAEVMPTPAVPPTDTPIRPTNASAPSLTPISVPGTIPVLTPTPFPLPTFTPGPASPTFNEMTLTGPLVVDSEAGRLYAAGLLSGDLRTLVLSAVDGSLVTAYDVSGQLGLDPVHGRLYVDRGEQGLAVLDTQTDLLDAVVLLPSRQTPGQGDPAPLADPAQDQVLAFRDHVAYIIDPQAGEVRRTIPFDIPKGEDCRTLDYPLPIERATYDTNRRILYLDFITYTCTPWIGHTLVSYDMTADKEIIREGMFPFQATAFDGYLYGTSWHRFGIGSHWAWREGEPWIGSTDWGGSISTFQVDPARQRLYEATDGNLRVFDAQTMSLMMSIPQPVDGRLVGYDPETDQLYFLSDGHLELWSAGAIQAPAPEPLSPSQPPAKPLRSLVVSPTWSRDKTLFGIWGGEILSGDCYAFDQMGGTLYLSQDGGATWGQPRGGLRGSCDQMSVIAVSPAYADDRTLLAGVVGTGIFKSTDGGQLWQPSSTGLGSMGIEQMLISPGFDRDSTVFARLRTDGLHRSTDGGRTWQALDVDLYPVAISHEFEKDRILMGIAYASLEQRAELRISRDGGDHWERVGDTPGGTTFNLLSLAPLFEKWHVAFGYGGDGTLYRSEDGGVNWKAVLNTDPVSLMPPQLFYAPDIEVNRPVFLLSRTMDGADPPSVRGTLYRSHDGGQTWQAVQLPEDVSPTALAISPDFVRDHLLFVGTADGRVLALDVSNL